MNDNERRNRGAMTATTELADFRYATDQFTKRYNALAYRAAEMERQDNTAAANLHVEIANAIARYHDAYSGHLDNADRTFLRAETVARCMQALLLRSIELSGFGDIAISLGSARKLDEDLRKAKLRLAASTDADGTSEGDVDLLSETTDPRTHTEGLYEYMPYEDRSSSGEQPSSSNENLPGYERQHRQIVNAYYVLEDSSACNDDATAQQHQDGSKTEATPPLRKTSRAGSNVILYGPPGTGKTVAVRAVATFLQLDFVFVNSENLMSSYRSETEKNLRKLYAKMRALVRRTGRNVVLLLDEVDGLVKNRGTGDVSGADYSLLTKFLTILEPNDGTDNYGIMSVFTTNRLDNLDDAFQRRCTKIFFGQIANDSAHLRLLTHFFGHAIQAPIMHGGDNVTIDTRVLNFETMIACDREVTEVMLTTRDWVPGDYVRFTREVLKPLRLQEYLKQRGIGENQFYAHHSHFYGGGGNRNNRTINVDLPRISLSQLLVETCKFRPTTPDERYRRDFPTEAKLDDLERSSSSSSSTYQS